MWNFDHYLFKPSTPNHEDTSLSNSFTNQMPSSRHSFISQLSFADEATETNLRAIEINQKTNIELLISNSWPKSSRNMCDEKRTVIVDINPPNEPSPPSYNSPSDIFMSEANIGNPNHVEHNDTQSVELVLNNNGELDLRRTPSDPGIFSNSFVHYIDWGPSEFIDDF